jgi:transposase
MKRIGDEITEELEYEPPKYYVNRYIRPKYALPKDEGVVIGHLPSRPIEKGIAGPGVIAHLLISKYIDHLPFYRQLQQFKRFGLELAESIVCDWGKAGSDLVQPLVDLLKKQVLSASYLMAHETPIKVLDPAKKGTTHQGYYWVYYDPLGKQVFFDYQKSRSREGPKPILKQFKG